MAVTSDDHRVQIGDSTVVVNAKTGPVHATWVLLIDEEEVDQAKAAGDFTLTGHLPDDSSVAAKVHQSLLGPTEVTVLHQGGGVARFTGFVA
jgi:hypothetical protein